jgi:hypothetical protein
MANGTPIPNELAAIQTYLSRHMNVQDHTLRLSYTMAHYASLRSDIKSGTLSSDECIAMCSKLEAKLEALIPDMPKAWQYSTTSLSQKSERILDLHFDSYPHPNICQAWNVLRVARILLNETVIDLCLGLAPNDKYTAMMEAAQSNVEVLAREICAGAPQYIDCGGAARQVRPPSEKSQHTLSGTCHSHIPNHRAACHSIIFALYTAGRSKASSDVRRWVIEQLHYMGSHFCSRNAEVVAQILDRGDDPCPWEVYGMLGGYAFNA